MFGYVFVFRVKRQSSDPKEKEEIDEGESWSDTHGLAGPWCWPLNGELRE